MSATPRSLRRSASSASDRVENIRFFAPDELRRLLSAAKKESARDYAIMPHEAIAEYIAKAELKSGPLFRPRLNPRSKKLSGRGMNPATLCRLIQGYLKACCGWGSGSPRALPVTVQGDAGKAPVLLRSPA